jgi:uncharacterized membrane protein
MIDLRHRVLQWAELKRRAAAGETLSDEERAVLDDGIPAREYREQIIDMIRHERRSASSAGKVKAKEAKAQLRVVQPLSDFLTKEHDG